MKQLLLFLLFIPSLLMAQEDQKYLAGAIPEEGGKVVFTKEINMPSLSKGQIYDIMYQWAEKFFSEEGRRLVYSDKDKGDIAAVGEEYLVFQSTALSLDRTLMDYRVTIECEDNAAKIKLAGIRYEYNVSYQREPEKYTAEEWITDKYALNKKKDKLNRGNGKFRRKTVDFAENMKALEDAGVTADTSTEDLAALLKDEYDFEDETANSFARAFGVYTEHGADAIAAWDYSRAMYLLSAYYHAGYYTEQEALDKSLEVAQTIQSMYESWDDFMDSYLWGYDYWAEEESTERREIYNKLKAQSDSPFRFDFKMNLEKTW